MINVHKKMKNSLKVFLRKVSFSDIEFLWHLRNRPDVYKYSRERRPVSWEEHVKWILPIILEISDKKLFIVQNPKVPIGQIRFDHKGPEEVEISVSILKEFGGRGFGTKALSLAIEEVKKQKRAKKLIAEIHKNNLLHKII